MADEYREYFLRIGQELRTLYSISKQARAKGLDPSLEPEPHVAKDLAERVEGLVGPPGVAERIRELSGKMTREEIAFKIAEEIVYAKFGHMSEQEVAEQAIRTSLAILSDITAAPIQGVARVSIKQNPDRTRYLAIYFAGPIRSAGGTEPALTLVIGDFIRRMLGFERYKPSEDEIRRFIEEIRIYERDVSRFQYHIPDEILENALRNLPVEVTGTETDPIEVSSFRNLPRIETNRVRGGALRVLNDGIVGRSQKVWKIVEKLGIDGWEWLKKIRETKEETADFMYMEDVIAGRPIFSFPSRSGGFRLRYGRARNTGLAALGVHPATMIILQNFLAIGTQLRIEKPGKAGIVLPVDTIDPPIVRLKDGSVVCINTASEAKELGNYVDKILFLGDLLVSFGEFLENNAPLAPSGFSQEWWIQILHAAIKTRFKGSIEEAAITAKISPSRLDQILRNPFKVIPTAEEALLLSKTLSIPLHPHYIYFWQDLTTDELLELRHMLLQAEKVIEDMVVKVIKVPLNSKIKPILEKLCVPHKVVDRKIIIEKDAPILNACLQLSKTHLRVKRRENPLEMVWELGEIEVLDKGATYIGARMGRPEKAKRRAMVPPVHVLFPVGLAGGPRRDVLEAVKIGVIDVEIVRRKCSRCDVITHKALCPECGSETILEKVCPRCGRVLKEEVCPVCRSPTVSFERRSINIKEIYNRACETLGTKSLELIKGVRGLTSETKTPEPLEKGILRAKYELFVFKDGTIRFDATNAPLTHFKPSEINASLEKLQQLGYTHDQNGEPLQNVDQLCELKVQDIIIPEKCARYLVKVAQFIDELLQNVYGLPPYYNVKNEYELIGHLVIGLAPHTSAGVIGRIIGFTKASVCYAHPLWHSSKRRDCDGDEDALILVLDTLLNFSRAYLPAQIGGMMDAPLLITSTVDPFEVEDQAHNVDVAKIYPPSFYEKSLMHADPKVASRLIDTIAHRLGTPAQFQGYGYTHETDDINTGNYESAYKKLGSMTNKVASQLLLAEKISAVDVNEVAKRVLTTHFIRDIVGNLKAFTSQKFRCKKCNTKYRRTPLSGKCPKCGREIVLTVYRGGVEKYLDVAEKLAKKYNISNYHQQRINLIRDELETLFKSKIKQIKLGEFM